MTIEVFKLKDYEHKKYNVSYHSLHFDNAPLSGMVGQIEPGESSLLHNHFEVEYFLFLSGVGHVNIDNQIFDVVGGMGIKIPAFSNHIIKNKSQTEELRFLSFYWSDSSLEPPIIKKPNDTLIFATPPTPNGDMHLGHLSGPYLAADIYRRFLLESGSKAIYATGRDDHQTYLVVKAHAENTTPMQIANENADKIQRTLQQCEIKLDYFIEPNATGSYSEFVRRFFKKLYDAGLIVAKEEHAAFSADETRYLHEGFIRGICPYCERESDGNACEECGRPNKCVDLKEAKDRISSKPSKSKLCKRLYFQIGKFKDDLIQYINTIPMSAHAMAASHQILSDKQLEICVSHPGDWGIQVPIDEFQNQIIYVWFEMALGYLWAALNLAPKDITDEMEKICWFYNREENEVVHFYGFDNTFYHTILFPAVYLALGNIKLPSAHVVNELLDLEGSKFSTSRNHLIWGRDLFNKVPVDYGRWYLSKVRPEGTRSNFVVEDFIQSVNHFFAENLNKLTGNLSQLLVNHFSGEIPESGAWTVEQRAFYHKILAMHTEVLHLYQIANFSPRKITQVLASLIDITLNFLVSHEFFLNSEETYDYARTGTALAVLSLKIFALLARPILTDTSLHLLSAMGYSVNHPLHDTSFVPSGTKWNVNIVPKFSFVTKEDMEGIMQHG
jgi:methionyl-tRNA synthetase